MTLSKSFFGIVVTIVLLNYSTVTDCRAESVRCPLRSVRLPWARQYYRSTVPVVLLFKFSCNYLEQVISAIVMLL